VIQVYREWIHPKSQLRWSSWMLD